MPDIVVHAKMGNEVCQRLKERGISLNRRIFSFALMGPDPFLFSLPHYYRYSSIMHRERTGEFLLQLAKRCRNKDEFSFLSGFLCHYALDSVAHPFVVGMAQERYGADNWRSSMLHIAIEHRLDVLAGGNAVIPALPSEKILDYFCETVQKVYGWKNSKTILKTGYFHLPAFYWFVKDRRGIVDKLFGWTKGPAAMISSKSHICDSIDLSGFTPLYERSIPDAVSFIECAHAFVHGHIRDDYFRQIIGNRPYI